MFTPRSYQLEALDFIAKKRGRCLLALPPGSGKTFTSLYLRIKYPEIKKVLVICPASVKLQWKYAFDSMFQSEQSTVISGGKTELFYDRILETECNIINYEILGDTKRWSGWVAFLETIKYDLIIIDESHRVKNKDSNRSRAVERLILRNRHVLELTGTPLLSSIADLWNQLHIIAPSVFTSFSRFEKEFCPRERKSFRKFNKVKQEVETVTVWQQGAPRRISKLRALLSQYFFIKESKAIFTELPEVVETIVPITLTNYKEYNKSETVFMNTDRRKHDEMYRSFQELRKVIGLGKIEQTIQWIDDYFTVDENRKLVVFGYHRKVLEDLHEHYKDVSTLFYGGMSIDAKETAKSEFINNENVKIIFANIKSAGLGVDGLHLATNTCLFCEIPDNSADVTQAIARIRRLNSEFTNYLAYFLVAEDTIDERLCKLVIDKKIIEDMLFKKEAKYNVIDFMRS